MSVADWLVDNPLALLFAVLGIGTALGNLRWRGLGLGPAAVLFVALALSAYDERLALPEILGSFGLAVFAFAIGVTAGPSFFASLRAGAGPCPIRKLNRPHGARADRVQRVPALFLKS